MIDKVNQMTISELSEGLRTREFSAEELTRHSLQMIEQKEPELNAFITVTAERAIEDAKAADKRLATKAETNPLLGIPGALKDNVCTKGIRTTCASKTLENFVPPYSATVADRLADTGMVLLGKVNMDEFAMGQTSETSYFGATKNPRNTNRVPGGSSGGSAAAVAGDEAVFAIGSDTGGSILQPSAFCGVIGLRPSYGLVSRNGIVAFASSLDQAGPITRTVKDNALVLNAIAGHDPRDTTSLHVREPDYTVGITDGVKGLTFGLPTEFFGEGLAESIKDAVLDVAKKLESLGATIKEVSLPSLKFALPAYVLISSAEASSNLARFDGIHYGYRAEGAESLDDVYVKTRSEGFGAEVKRRLMLGTFALSSGYYDAYYKKAQQIRTLIGSEFKRVFASVSMLIAPVAPVTAWPLGQSITDPVQLYLNDIYTVPIGMAGLPALSLPVAKDEDGLPIGLQLIGNRFQERLLYRAGVSIEEVTR
jgi:aspartyl-tRNA(Asn)/glutamyl-tRNA(Gln) amidotransferase subunit A